MLVHNWDVDQRASSVTWALRLKPELASAGRARQWVAEVLDGWGLDHLADDVALGVSELVANAVLHARTEIEVVLKRQGAGVRAEVRDWSLQPVSVPWYPPATGGEAEGDDAAIDGDFDLVEESMTGRGLLVVASLADAWGTEMSETGKTVWMEAGTGAAGSARELDREVLAGHDRLLERDQTSPHEVEPGLVPVRLVAVPVRLALASDANLDDLIREFQVLTLAGGIHHSVPTPLISLIEQILDRYAEPRLAGREAARRAAAAGQRLFDFTAAVPPAVVPDMWHLTSVLDQVAAFCRQGTLLSLAPSEELSAFRRWWVSEVERQVAGKPPTPCPFPVVPVDDFAADDLGNGMLASERAARSVAEQAATRLAGLQEITAGLSRAVEPGEVAEVVLGRGLDLLGATSGSLCLLCDDGETVEIVRAVGLPEDVAEHWRHFALSDDLPASEAIRTGNPVLIRNRLELQTRYPVFTRTPTAGSMANAIMPLTVESGRVLGALAIGYPAEQFFPAADRAFLDALATQTAQALDRARLHEAERRARERFAFLAEASAVLNASLDLPQMLAELSDLVVPRLADWCSIHLLDEGGEPAFVTAAHVDPARRAMAFELHQRWPVTLGEGAIGACLVTGDPVLFQVIPPDLLARTAQDEEHLRFLESLGVGSGMVVPLQAGGRVLGAVAMANDQGRMVSDDDFSLAQDLAARAGAAVANAKLFAERSHVARSLQASLLPPALPRPPGVDFGASYAAAGEGLDVGGDFFDVFAVGTSWMVVVGDVRGKGVDAAAVTGLARHTIRSRSLSDPSPRAVLQHLNDLLLRAEADRAAAQGAAWDLEPRFCSVVAMALEQIATGWKATICVAGHPLPLLRRPDGSVEPVGVTGDVLGVFADVNLSDCVVELEPGDAVVAFTDGIVERHRGPTQFGEEGVSRVLNGAGAASAAELAARVQDAARAFVDGQPDDDMAVVVVRVPVATSAG